MLSRFYHRGLPRRPRRHRRPQCEAHLLSIWTLFLLVMAVYLARHDNIRQHKIWMVLLYILALLVTGVFTLWPGRVMHGVLFGV